MTTTRRILAGTTDVSVVIRIIDSADGTPETGVVFNTSGIDLQYRRELAASVAITEATLAALTTAHSDGGFLHIGNGYYRLDLPDLACAAGATGVLVHGTVTGMVVIGTYIELVAYNPYDAVRLGLSALPSAAADAVGGLPISDAGGLDLDSKLANTNEITTARMGALTDWINGGRLDLILDDILQDTGTTLDDLIDDLESRLTATRAGYLDNLSAGVVALEATAQAILDDTGTAGVVVATASKTGYALSTAGVQAIWDALTSVLSTVGSIGKLLVDNINATISSRSSHSAADVWSAATRLLTAGTNIVLAKGVGITGFNDLSAAQVNAEVDTALADYDGPTSAELVTEINSIQTDIAALNNLSAAQVNAEVVDALNVDSYAEIGQEAPPATTTLVKKIGYLYKAFRNKKTQTSTTLLLFADDGTTVDQKATISDDATTYTHGEIVTGP